MKIRPRPVALIAIGLILFTLGLWVWAIHFRAKRAVLNYKLQLIAAGEKLTVDELIPKPVPPEQNSADIFLKAVAKVEQSTRPGVWSIPFRRSSDLLVYPISIRLWEGIF